MDYVKPIGKEALPDDPAYVDGDPANNVEGDPVSAKAWENPMREILAVIDAAAIERDAEDLTQLAAAIEALSKMNTIADVPFMAGWGVDGAGEDLAVQPYGYLVLARPVKFTGASGYIESGSSGAAVRVNVEADGSNIFSVNPEFAAGSNALTPGVFIGGAPSVTYPAGTRLKFNVVQIGSVVAGQRIGFTLKGEAA